MLAGRSKLLAGFKEEPSARSERCPPVGLRTCGSLGSREGRENPLLRRRGPRRTPSPRHPGGVEKKAAFTHGAKKKPSPRRRARSRLAARS